MTNNHFPYTVQAGDSLSKIALTINAAKGLTVTAIEHANPTIEANNLQAGQVIAIPGYSGKTLHYTVQAGDSLSSIVQNINAAAGVTYQQIEQANAGIDPNKIFVGQVLSIPTGDSAETPPANSPSTPTAPPNSKAENIGYWHWTYHHSYDPPSTNMGMAFYGSVDPAEAIQQSAKVKDRLQGDKYICLGGGTSSGSYHSAAISKIGAAIQAGDFAGYQGIAFDIEVGGAGLENDFQHLFALAKNNNFKVLVTISHSRPYGIKDGNTLMNSFFSDPNIDFLSPQLYTTGKEHANDYTAYGIKWSDYANAQAAVIPSIVKAAFYADALSYFQAQGVALKGYVQWSQN